MGRMVTSRFDTWRSKQHYQVNQGIEYFNVDLNDIANQPLFILDEDPVRCAQALTTNHIKKYIEYIVYSTIIHRASDYVIEKSGALNQPRIDYMYYSPRTAYWFYNMYEEMQRLYKARFGKAYKVSEYFKESWMFDISATAGPSVKRKQYKRVRLPSMKSIREKYNDIYCNYKYTINKMADTISKFRVMYMIMGYTNDEFPNGAPIWYSCMKSTIWKSFSKLTRLYYRIDTNVEGTYSYYYSVDDINWIEIPNIPFSMRGLIDGIIFAREV